MTVNVAGGALDDGLLVVKPAKSAFLRIPATPARGPKAGSNQRRHNTKFSSL